ncbi:hypothetical protein AYX07_10870 [Thermoactinomyces sp. AS95]|nr:hypothetical protein AYX07_10870 [Thermoactinomyces sp. AS95]
MGMDHLLSKELISSKNVSKSHVSHSLVFREYWKNPRRPWSAGIFVCDGCILKQKREDTP